MSWPLPLAKPQRLRPGDRVAIVTPSWGGPAAFPHRYATGKQQLSETFGLDLVEMPHALAAPDWLARHPEARAADLMVAFADPAIKGIIASIGGDDAVRLIRHVDLAMIAANPKVVLGYSDITVLHFGCLKAGLGSFYGPTIMAGFGENGGIFDYLAQSVRRTLFGTEAIGRLEPNRDGWTDERLSWGDPSLQNRRRRLNPSSGPLCLRGSGSVRGRLIGGCADVLEMLKGTAWWPPVDYWRDAVFFIETSEEAPPPRQLRRWLRNYHAQGILECVAAILLGRPGSVDPAKHGAYGEAVLGALDEAGLDALPVIANLDFGHTDPYFTIPYGVTVEIDCATASVTVLEAGAS
jgi:muramoyltetrapeptide carboxypeptidase LdcA involved in peptidoglycan recycling